MPYMQIYLLNVLSSILAGACLSRHMLAEKFEGFKPYEQILEGKVFQLVLSIVTLLAGLFSLLTKTPEDVLFIGDLIPGLAALFTGGLILADFLYDSEDDTGGFLASVAVLREKYGAIAGIATIVIALLHAFIPMALFF